MHEKTKAFAEVLESSLVSFKAQSWKWNSVPPFGSLVTIASGNNRIVGIITGIQTGSFDPMRYPFPYQKTQEELLRDHPQIFEFLKTIFTVHALGIEQETHLEFRIPQAPCTIHSFVAQAHDETYKKFATSSPDYLNILFAAESAIGIIDELCIALMHTLASKNLVKEELLEAFAYRFSLLSGNDYRRLKQLIGRVQKLIEK